MKIGYPCINWTLGCKSDRTFRLKSYSEEKLIETVQNNISCLLRILQFNIAHEIFFFRITSDLVPFASHPVCRFNWLDYFKGKFIEIGDLIKTHSIRISMRPGQYTIINAIDASVLENSIRDLDYHTRVLDAMGLDTTARIQIHAGGVYGNKEASMRRFVERYLSLEDTIRRRLLIENDDRSYSLRDCISLHNETGIPVLFDVLHHEIHSSGESVTEAFELFTPTWKEQDGLPMVDYSSQKPGRAGVRHAESIDPGHFEQFLKCTRPHDFDIMLEIKDKEKSALEVVQLARKDERFFRLTGNS